MHKYLTFWSLETLKLYFLVKHTLIIILHYLVYSEKQLV